MTTHKVTAHRRYDKEYDDLEYTWDNWKFIATSPEYPQFRAFAYVSKKEFALGESKRLARMHVSLDIKPSEELRQCNSLCGEFKLISKFEIMGTGERGGRCRKCASVLSGNYVRERKDAI